MPPTWASWLGLLTGPNSTSSLSGMPVWVPLACSASAATKSSYTPRPGEHARGRGAVLTGVEVAGDGDALRRSGDVGVVEHDDRCLATELEVQRFRRLRGGRGHLLAGAHRAGDADHRRRVVRDHRPAGVAITADHVEHAGREELGGDLGEQRGAGRRRVAGLQHDALPAASAGANFHTAIIIG